MASSSENIVASAQDPSMPPAWWPINLAPLDRPVLLYDPKANYVQVGYWDGDRWVMVDVQTGGFVPMNPTLFFPYPAP